MKRNIMFVLIVLAFSLTSFVAGYAANPGPIKFKYSHFMPPTHPFAVLGGQFCEEIKKRTEVKLK